ncbi:hypothetical protein ACLGI4_20685 [Streptomyces sp. HMX112]|uniref:hypothetical protein n=1 Tax=Streptomyces sp. HMX112 TaxID=3390850 RepID=UPI003A807431
MSDTCAECGSRSALRPVAVRDGKDVLACPAHAAKLAGPVDDTLAAIAWYQHRRRTHPH